MLLLSILILTTSTQTSLATFSDINSLPTVDLIRKNGYVGEIHHVTTQDGYILELHRIPQSKSRKQPTKNHPVLIHHGFLGSSADWVIGEADKCLPMQLADDGYDVWLANSRGNTYSKNHVRLSISGNTFWNFSLHEIGIYDLPAVIDHVLKKTNSHQLHYVGFSMGSTVFFIIASERPEYQLKIRSKIGLAPAAYLYGMKSSIRFLAPYAKMMNRLLQTTNHGIFMPQTWQSKFIANVVCRQQTVINKSFCKKSILLHSVCGSDSAFINTKLWPVIMGHVPSGSSSKTLSHFAQFILKNKFNQYDYGRSKNRRFYNSTEPPSYNLRSIQVPISLFYGENDKITVPEDVKKLIDQLPQLLDVILVKNRYCHLDFMWSINVDEQIFNPVKKLLQKTDNLSWHLSPRSKSSLLAISKYSINYSEKENNNDINIVKHRTPNPLNGSQYKTFLTNSSDIISSEIFLLEMNTTMKQCLNGDENC